MEKQQYHFVSMAEAKKLKKGDIIFIGLRNGTSLTYQKTVVLSPLFWNSDSDEPDYELETTNGFVDINSIYLPKDDDDNEETIEVLLQTGRHGYSDTNLFQVRIGAFRCYTKSSNLYDSKIKGGRVI